VKEGVALIYDSLARAEDVARGKGCGPRSGRLSFRIRTRKGSLSGHGRFRRGSFGTAKEGEEIGMTKSGEGTKHMLATDWRWDFFGFTSCASKPG